MYLDVKKKIGVKGGLTNIPDGYLLDLSDQKPQLYVVENELAAHDPLRHIAVQILQFSLSFEAEPRAVKTILFSALQAQPDAKAQCEQYAATRGFRNLDDMLERRVYDGRFEVLELARYEDEQGARFYHFEPFLAELNTDALVAAGANAATATATPGPIVPAAQIDTVVVPAREEGFREVFLGENRWHAVRIYG